MKKKEVILKFNGKKKKFNVNVVPWWYEGIGLMFKRKNYANNLIFSFGRRVREPIHSLFVFRKFLAIWCDGDFNVLDCKVVSPWMFYVVCRRQYEYLIEIPFANLEDLPRRELDELLGTFK